MRRTLLILSFVLGSCSAVTLADQPKSEAPAQSQAAAGRTMTAEQLKDKLDAMGLEVQKDLTNSQGKLIGYRIKRSANGFDFTIDVTVSPSGEYIWITCCLADFSKSPIPAEKVEALLAQNGRQTAIFSYYAKTQRLYLKTYVPVLGFAPRHLIHHMEDLTTTATDTEADWNAAKWQKAESTPAPAPAK